jgi:hypothetical protein
LPLTKGTQRFYQVPGYGVFYPVLTRMDPAAFATWLTGWLQAHAGRLPAALALDGKMIRDHLGRLTLAQHEDGAPQAVAVYDQKENTPRCELTAAAALLAALPALDDQLITADPLHGQRAHARTLVEKGGNYLFRIKGNQPKLLTQAPQLDALQGPPFLSPPKAVTGGCPPGGSTPSTSNR